MLRYDGIIYELRTKVEELTKAKASADSSSPAGVHEALDLVARKKDSTGGNGDGDADNNEVCNDESLKKNIKDTSKGDKSDEKIGKTDLWQPPAMEEPEY
eukprot:TRINITY_DN6459_c0_g1_i1.p3 TRINITY_DN6459_c0_g1~~TRINITY_DN6459_c0_g1_i1.p3  ORF type:complete len:100 (-),score=26.25 TRINITY_DN6459_c0_g1_i1:1926-2225(-)